MSCDIFFPFILEIYCIKYLRKVCGDTGAGVMSMYVSLRNLLLYLGSTILLSFAFLLNVWECLLQVEIRERFEIPHKG